jgi:hypothetical protein
MYVDKGQMTTQKIYRDCDDWSKQKVPGDSFAERHMRLCVFWEENYNVPEIVAASRRLNKEIMDPINKEIEATIRRIMREDKEK